MISFGDDAFDSLVRIANEIPAGYVVALMDDSHGDPDKSPAVVLTKVDHDAVWYRVFDEATGEGKGRERKMAWTDVERIHVY